MKALPLRVLDPADPRGPVELATAGVVRIPIYKFGDGRMGPVWKEGAKRYKRPYRTLARARIEAKKVAIRLNNQQVTAEVLTAADRQIYQYVKFKAGEHGMNPAAAIDQWIEWRVKYGTLPKPRPLSDVIELFIASKSDECHKRRPGREAKSLRASRADLKRLSQFLGTIAAPDIKADMIATFLRGLGTGPRRRNNVRAEIVALFNFARDRGFVPDVRKTEAEKVKRIKIVRAADEEPETYTPRQLRILLKYVSQDWLPWLLIAAFAGLRTEEICEVHIDQAGERRQLCWEDFLWEERKIDVCRLVSKTGEQRYAELSEQLFEHLRPWHNATGPAISVAGRYDKESIRLTGVIRKAVEEGNLKPGDAFEWKTNGLRHSYASYWMAIHNDRPRLCELMGNSPGMIRRNYRSPKFVKEAREWFGIMPNWPGNVVQFELFKSEQNGNNPVASPRGSIPPPKTSESSNP